MFMKKLIKKHINVLKRALPILAALTLFSVMGFSSLAGDLPRISERDSVVTLSGANNMSDTVRFDVKNWRNTAPFIVMMQVADPTICTVSVESQGGDYFNVRFEGKATGTTVAKIWIDGFSRNARYITIDSIRYYKENKGGIDIGHYGYMTGTRGESAKITNVAIDTVNDKPRLCIFFDMIDMGMSNGSNATFQVKCEKESGESLGRINQDATGMLPGGKGYKLYFRLPGNAKAVKIENMDF